MQTTEKQSKKVDVSTFISALYFLVSESNKAGSKSITKILEKAYLDIISTAKEDESLSFGEDMLTMMNFIGKYCQKNDFERNEFLNIAEKINELKALN
ncbi:MAG: hypothetical protein SFT90_00600 [Rickettsiales bacterium]|nr:hypothetical protein [Rickettsiales bacterium]